MAVYVGEGWNTSKLVEPLTVTCEYALIHTHLTGKKVRVKMNSFGKFETKLIKYCTFPINNHRMCIFQICIFLVEGKNEKVGNWE